MNNHTKLVRPMTGCGRLVGHSRRAHVHDDSRLATVSSRVAPLRSTTVLSLPGMGGPRDPPCAASVSKGPMLQVGFWHGWCGPGSGRMSSEGIMSAAYRSSGCRGHSSNASAAVVVAVRAAAQTWGTTHTHTHASPTTRTWASTGRAHNDDKSGCLQKANTEANASPGHQQVRHTPN